jgi:hypothetical protein
VHVGPNDRYLRSRPPSSFHRGGDEPLCEPPGSSALLPARIAGLLPVVCTHTPYTGSVLALTPGLSGGEDTASGLRSGTAAADPSGIDSLSCWLQDEASTAGTNEARRRHPGVEKAGSFTFRRPRPVLRERRMELRKLRSLFVINLLVRPTKENGAASNETEPGNDDRTPRREVLELSYRQICDSYHNISDFRAKLLALLPLATGTGGILLLREREQVRALGPIGLFGVVVTAGLCRRIRVVVRGWRGVRLVE